MTIPTIPRLKIAILNFCIQSVHRDGNGARRVRKMGSLSPSRMVFFIPSLPPPYMTVKIFLLHPRPLESYETPPHPVKLNFLLICPQLLHLFLIKPISLIKIYLKLKINLSYQIKLIFSKN